MESRLGFSLGPDHISFEVDESVYPLEAVYGACYLFLEKCFVYLSRSKPEAVDGAPDRARGGRRPPSWTRWPASSPTSCCRRPCACACRSPRRAFASTTRRRRCARRPSAPSVDDLLAELESEELLEDPLEIMVPWEEKHGAKPNDGRAEEGSRDAAMAERITFDRSLYLPEAVEAAAAAYAEHATIEVTPSGRRRGGGRFRSVSEHDPQTVAHAFCNHVLHETIARRRQAALEEGA